jgi:cell division protein FtsA
LKLAGITLESLASAEPALSDEEREAGVVLVDIGGGTTDLVIFYGDVIRYSAVIPFGGNIVTDDIKEGCCVLQKQAEAIKITHGSTMGSLASENKIIKITGMQGWEPKHISCKNLAYIIQARMEEIIECINFHIKKSGYADKLGAGIVITGGGAMLKNVSQLIKLQTGIDVRVGRPNTWISDKIIPFDEMSQYSTAVGLMLGTSSIYVPQKDNGQKLFEPETAETHNEHGEKKIDKKKKDKKKKELAGSFMGNLFSKIFNDDDTDMLDDKDK